MALFGRSPRLLPASALPAGFSYPADLTEHVRADALPAWEWLSGSRLDQAAERLWRVFPRELVPLASRRGTTFVMCLDAAVPSPDGSGFEVVTVDATDPSGGTVQHLPDLESWLRAAADEARGALGDGPGPSVAPSPEDTAAPSPVDPRDPSTWQTGSGPAPDDRSWEDTGAEPPVAAEQLPGVGWAPPERGACACVHHLDSIASDVVPYGMNAPAGLPPRTVADLVMAGELRVEPDYPGPEVMVGKRRIGPFHWRGGLGQGARLHQDDDGRVPIDSWLMWNPGVGYAAWPERGDLILHAPGLCRDGVLTLLGRALLDDRVRRRRPRRG